jgi:hypothetical protein
MLPKPTIAPLQIEQTLTPASSLRLFGVELPTDNAGKARDRPAVFAVGAMLGGKSVKHGKDGATDRAIG